MVTTFVTTRSIKLQSLDTRRRILVFSPVLRAQAGITLPIFYSQMRVCQTDQLHDLTINPTTSIIHYRTLFQRGQNQLGAFHFG